MKSTPFNSQFTTPHSTRGFTLVELLVSLAIIFILVGLTFYSLKTIRRSAGRTESFNALRQLTGGYASYSSEHNGALMTGYIDPNDFTDPTRPFYNMKVRLVGSGYELLPEDKAGYVWRLAPYLDNAWKTYMADYRSAEIESRFTTEYSCGSDSCPPYSDPDTGTTYTPPPGVFGPASTTGTQLGIALRPSFGLNSVFLGGDSVHGDPCRCPFPPPVCPTPPLPRVAAVRVSEVRNPARIIVFGATRAADSETLKTQKNTNVALGYPVLVPPYESFDAETQTPGNTLWLFDSSSTSISQIELTNSAGMSSTGLPFDRLGDGRVPVSHLDGSVGSEILQSLGPIPGANPSYVPRMTLWSPFAVGKN